MLPISRWIPSDWVGVLWLQDGGGGCSPIRNDPFGSLAAKLCSLYMFIFVLSFAVFL